MSAATFSVLKSSMTISQKHRRFSYQSEWSEHTGTDCGISPFSQLQNGVDYTNNDNNAIEDIPVAFHVALWS